MLMAPDRLAILQWSWVLAWQASEAALQISELLLRHSCECCGGKAIGSQLGVLTRLSRGLRQLNVSAAGLDEVVAVQPLEVFVRDRTPFPQSVNGPSRRSGESMMCEGVCVEVRPQVSQFSDMSEELPGRSRWCDVAVPELRAEGRCSRGHAVCGVSYEGPRERGELCKVESGLLPQLIGSRCLHVQNSARRGSERLARSELVVAGLLEVAKFNVALDAEADELAAVVPREQFELLDGHAARCDMSRSGDHERGASDLKTPKQVAESGVGPCRSMHAERDPVNFRPEILEREVDHEWNVGRLMEHSPGVTVRLAD